MHEDPPVGPLRPKTTERIARARALHETWGAACAASPEVAGAAAACAGALAASRRAMEDLRVIETCRLCEEEDGGSCCGFGIEDRYDETLLLANLLLGVPVPERRVSSESCFFLGEGGCGLRVRHVICVNYVCARLRSAVPPEDFTRLQAAWGAECDATFHLVEALRRWLKSR